MKQIGIVGAGVMGRGLAHDLARTGHSAILVDVNADILDSAREDISRNLRLYQMFGHQQVDDIDGVLDRIEYTHDLTAIEKAEFVIENVTECWSTKKDVYARLATICPSIVVFAANTSAIPITRIGAVSGRPDRTIGMHFMNPVPLKPVVEVIRGYHTSDTTVDTAKSLLAGLGKEAVIVNDAPGFVSNRVLMLSVNEAIYLVQDGVASVEDIDRIFKSCFGHKMGMLETADLIGLDTILFSIEVLYESFNDSKYRPCPLLKKMVDAGLLGRKAGKGFYSY